MQISSNNLVKDLIANIKIGRWIILGIFVVSFAFCGAAYILNATYQARGILLVQKAQNSTIQEFSAGLGRLSADEMSPMGKDHYTEKFLLYLNTRDFFLESSLLLLDDPRIDNVRSFLKISDEDMANDSRYLPSDSMETKENYLINILASDLSGMSSINKSGNLGIEIAANAGNPEIAIIIAENLMKSASQFIVKRELKELNAAKEYIELNVREIENELSLVFETQLEAIRKNPKIQQASKKILLEKVARISGQIDALVSEIRGNELVLKELVSLDEKERRELLKKGYSVSSRYKTADDSLREHLEAIKNKRLSYINSGVSTGSALIENIDREILSVTEMLNTEGSLEKTNSKILGTNLPIPVQIQEIERMNFSLEQKRKSLQNLLNDIFAEGIEFATYEQQNENLLKRSEIRYSLLNDLSKQLFKVEMYRISFQNKIMEIEKPSYRTISRKPTIFATMVLATALALLLSFLYIQHIEISDPVIKSQDDLRDFGLPIFGNIPPIRFRFKSSRTSLASAIDHFIDNSDSIVFKNIRSKYIKQHLSSGRISTLCLITSGRPSEGKSFFTLNIAASLANAGYKVVIVDTDARKQGLTALVGGGEGHGLIECLKGAVKIKDILKPTTVNNVMKVPAGRFSHDTSELLMGDKMKSLLAELRQQFDFVIVDTAPILAIFDAVNFVKEADIITIMARVSQTRLKDLRKTVEAVNDEGKLPNLVLNMSGSISTYYYHKNGHTHSRTGENIGSTTHEDSSNGSAA